MQAKQHLGSVNIVVNEAFLVPAQRGCIVWLVGQHAVLITAFSIV